MLDRKSIATLSETQLIELCSRYYPSNLVAKCYSENGSGPDDLLAGFIATEVASTRNDQASAVSQIGQVIDLMDMAKQDVTKIIEGMTADLVETILRDFLDWSVRRERTITPVLLDGWLAVHEDDVVRQYQGLVISRFNELFPSFSRPGGVPVTMDLVKSVLASLQKTLKLPEHEASKLISIKIPNAIQKC